MPALAGPRRQAGGGGDRRGAEVEGRAGTTEVGGAVGSRAASVPPARLAPKPPAVFEP
eukprot:CAMPEP_0206417766 /NCGR_PEP_ID=MMETSP0294-20121207/37528_1 /ASSEMBLY_ACC=CAM_ASM_000327 /TAXON_ID=39354 /ORGANISM="Heterosigma akashiwo, Strain CCMP2393" /LENGTH=57 /DNA_ID=CAMNT_0053880655 /DNA_START=456 /DNA_END=629 /DNA_ORIENTATION=+